MLSQNRAALEKLRTSEHAEIDAWFSAGPTTLLFHGLDGQARAIDATVAAAVKNQAEALIDAYSAEEASGSWLVVGVVGAGAFIGYCFADIPALPGFIAAAAGGGFGHLLLIVNATVRLARMNLALRALRRDTAYQLRGTAPVPAEIGRQYSPANPYKDAIGIGFLIIFLLGIFAELLGGQALMFLLPIAALGLFLPVFFVLLVLSKRREAMHQGGLRRQRIAGTERATRFKT